MTDPDSNWRQVASLESFKEACGELIRTARRNGLEPHGTWRYSSDQAHPAVEVTVEPVCKSGTESCKNCGMRGATSRSIVYTEFDGTDTTAEFPLCQGCAVAFNNEPWIEVDGIEEAE